MSRIMPRIIPARPDLPRSLHRGNSRDNPAPPLVKHLLRRSICLLFAIIFMLSLSTLSLSTLSLFITTMVHAAPNAVTWPYLDVVLIKDGFSRSSSLVSPHDGTNRLFVLEQGGLIYIIQNGERLPTPFLDLSAVVAQPVGSCGECGLHGLAFPPDFAEEGYFFISYVTAEDLIGPDTGDPDSTAVGDTVISRFHVSVDPNVADPNSEEPILIVNQPSTVHHSNHMLFGPDGYLYIAKGEGGPDGDPYENAQDPASLHGKILRIQVSETATYTIPADNPFVGVSGYREEIWAMGLRNPWRFTFDPVTGDLYVADVGNNTLEEVNFVAAADLGNGGMNFGWPIREGTICFPPRGPQDCDTTGLVEPVVIYTHASGNCSVTGGEVYDPQLAGFPRFYLYGDLCSGRLWGLQRDGATWVNVELRDLSFVISSFAVNENKEFFILGLSGAVYQVVPYTDQPIVGLNITNDGPTVIGNATAFTATTTGGTNVSYTWNFGDGSAGGNNSATHTHTYSQTGIYTTTVVASNSTSVMTATTQVYVGDHLVAVTNNRYTPNELTINPGETVIWELVQGEHSVTADDGSFNQPLGSAWPPFAHTFTDTFAGSFVETAALNDTTLAYHCTLHSNMRGTITILQDALPVAGLSATNDGPKQTGAAIGFTAAITGGTEISYSWNFGDGASGTGITTTHAYTAAGLYTATVTAANETNSMSATTTVYVGDAVVDVADFAFTPRAITLPVDSTVVWVLRNGTHSVTAADGSFNQVAGDDWSPFVQTFSSAKEYPYHCTVHSNMTGTLVIGEVSKEDIHLPTIRNERKAAP